MTKLEKKIYKILTLHTQNCELHKVLTKVLKPFIIIEPKCKTKLIIDEIKKLLDND